MFTKTRRKAPSFSRREHQTLHEEDTGSMVAPGRMFHSLVVSPIRYCHPSQPAIPRPGFQSGAEMRHFEPFSTHACWFELFGHMPPAGRVA